MFRGSAFFVSADEGALAAALARRQMLAAAARENVVVVAARGADVPAHVLDEAQRLEPANGRTIVHPVLLRTLVISILVFSPLAARAEDAYRAYQSRVQAVRRTPGLVAFWDFVQREDAADGNGRFVAHAARRGETVFALDARNIAFDYWRAGRQATYADFTLTARGPFGQGVRFAPLREKDFRPVLLVPRERFHGTGLDIKGPRRSGSMVAWVVREAGNHAIAGIWHEGTDLSPPDDRAAVIQTGRRQYALFAGLAGNPGGAAVHVSENGTSSFGDKYARHMAVTPEQIPQVPPDAPAEARDAGWTVVGFVFDNARDRVTAYIDGQATLHWVDEPAKHPFYKWPYKAWLQAQLAKEPGLQPGEEPEFPRDQFYDPPQHGRVAETVSSQTEDERIVVRTHEFTRVRVTLRKDARGRFTVVAARELVALKVNPFWFPADLYAPKTTAEAGPFTVGRVIHGRRGAGMDGYLGGLAVFDRALGAREMKRLADIGRARTKGTGRRLMLLDLPAILGARPR